MFGIGLPELVIIVVIALIFIGPKQLPGVMRSVGKGLVDLKRASNDIRHTVQTEMDNIERDLEVKDIKKDFENNFGGVANKFGSLKLSQMSAGDKLEAVANAFEKGQEDLAARKENVAAAEAKEAESTTTASTTDSTVSKTNGTATT